MKGESGEDGGEVTRGEGEGEGEGEKKKAGLDPSTFTLVEAAQYGNLER